LFQEEYKLSGNWKASLARRSAHAFEHSTTRSCPRALATSGLRVGPIKMHQNHFLEPKKELRPDLYLNPPTVLTPPRGHPLTSLPRRKMQLALLRLIVLVPVLVIQYSSFLLGVPALRHACFSCPPGNEPAMPLHTPSSSVLAWTWSGSRSRLSRSTWLERQ
jgi:hypothetical protein